jgi:hypothetical protein
MHAKLFVECLRFRSSASKRRASKSQHKTPLRDPRPLFADVINAIFSRDILST